jgi:hypothetical protein
MCGDVLGGGLGQPDDHGDAASTLQLGEAVLDPGDAADERLALVHHDVDGDADEQLGGDVAEPC